MNPFSYSIWSGLSLIFCLIVMLYLPAQGVAAAFGYIKITPLAWLTTFFIFGVWGYVIGRVSQ